MKKTLIALLVLAGVSSAVEVITDIMPTSYEWKSYNAPEGGTSEWVNINWNALNDTNLEKDFSLLGITSVGSYGFNDKGTTQASTGQISVADECLTLTGRSGAAAVDTLFAQVVNVSSLLGNYTADNLTALTLNVDYTRSTSGDGWVGLYILDSNNELSAISGVTSNSLKTNTSGSVAISLTETQLNGVDDSDKLVVLLRDGSAGSTTTITSLSTTAVLVPEPATATLSLLALAGLAARRRRASR